jgi:hypothetical protein
MVTICERGDDWLCIPIKAVPAYQHSELGNEEDRRQLAEGGN